MEEPHYEQYFPEPLQCSRSVFDAARLFEACVQVAQSCTPMMSQVTDLLFSQTLSSEGFLSSSLLWDRAPHYVEWECGRVAGER